MAMSAISSENNVVGRVGLSCVWISFVLLLSLTAVLLFSRSGEAAPCTKGVNCYCDRVRGGDLNDPQLLLCEDFEAPTLVNDQGVGDGAPFWGPWYDHTGFSGCGRGHNNYWHRTYGGSVGIVAWLQGGPANPTRGCKCSYPTCFQGAWHPTNLWQANHFAGIAILTNNDFSSDVPSLKKPIKPGGSGVFQGNASLGHRICAPPQCSANGTSGILGEINFGRPLRSFGITMAVAYANNVASSGVLVGPWKHDGFRVPGKGRDDLLIFWGGGPVNKFFPFNPVMIMDSDTQATCQAKVNAATKVAGQFVCTDVSFHFRADAALYDQAVDWPFGAWACLRGHYENMGLSNGSIKVWFTGPANVEKKLIDISNVDMTGFWNRLGYTGFLWDAFANTNQPGQTPTTETTYRYEDNVHIRAGAPVSCSQIGYGAQRPSPSPPTGVQIR